MLGHLPVIRCLPTVASAGKERSVINYIILLLSIFIHSVRAGVTVYTPGHYSNEKDTKLFLDIFNSCGFCQDVPEQYIDGFTSFSGSGVAYVSKYITCTAGN